MSTDETVKTKLALEIAQLSLNKAELLAENERLQVQLNQFEEVIFSDEELHKLFNKTKEKLAEAKASYNSKQDKE